MEPKTDETSEAAPRNRAERRLFRRALRNKGRGFTRRARLRRGVKTSHMADGNRQARKGPVSSRPTRDRVAAPVDPSNLKALTGRRLYRFDDLPSAQAHSQLQEAMSAVAADAHMRFVEIAQKKEGSADFLAAWGAYATDIKEAFEYAEQGGISTAEKFVRQCLAPRRELYMAVRAAALASLRRTRFTLA